MSRVEFAESLHSFVRSTRWLLVGRLMQMDSVIPELLTSFAVTEICNDSHAAKEFEVILTYLELLKAVIMKLGREEWNWADCSADFIWQNFSSTPLEATYSSSCKKTVIEH